MISTPTRRAGAALALVATTVALGARAAPASAGAPALALRQAPSCRWEKLSTTLPQAVYFMGAAWDAGHGTLYLNGGLDATNATKRLVQALDLSDPDLGKATARIVPANGPVQDFWGSAGAFHAAAANPDVSAALFWGGGEGRGNVTQEGTGQKILQTYVPRTSLWTTAAMGPTGVVLAAGAADPVRDIITYVGGVKVCDFFAATTADPLVCGDAQNQVTFLRFDPMTGTPVTQGGPTASGPGRVFGGSLVMDSTAGRMLYYGGLDDAVGGRARNSTFALDLSDADLGKAHWSQLGVTGQLPPARAFHGAAYDAGRNWMVVYGGVGQGFFTPGENALTDTWALDLGQAPPRWLNLGQTTPGERVGAAMAYAANHQAVLLAGGRRTFGANQQSVARDAYALVCGTGPAATATPGGTPATPTLPPPITAPPPTTPSPTAPPPSPGAKACPQLAGWKLVPDAVVADALANPARYYGWQQPNNPAVAPSPYNPLRTYLGLAVPGKPYHPIFNSVMWKAGCP